ncbi:MAG: radical SAM protein, partial [Eubacteriaceae bacterium]|nr:radical SAM protein [Eubacteriaceae bacterium]
HFHVSMQSGAKEVLKNMKRRYTKEEYKQVIGSIRKYFPEASITTDVMVGFPGETEDDFNETVNYIKEIRFSKLHVFKYSKRAGTPAAEYENQVPDRTKEKRSRLLIALSEELEKEYAGEFIGKEAEILIERKVKNTENYYSGHTKNYLDVTIESHKDITSKIVKVRILKLENSHLSGILIK